MKSRTRASIAALILALTLTGCSAAAPSASDEEVSPAPHGAFSDIDDLREAYVSGGGDCDDWKQTDTVRAAIASGDCSTSSVLMMFQSSSAAESTANTLLGMASPGEERALLLGENWLINAPDVRDVAESVGGTIVSTAGADPTPTQTSVDLSSDAGLCAADAEMTNLELNDAIAPLLGYPADRDSRTSEQDQAIREYKNAAFGRACPARVG